MSNRKYYAGRTTAPKAKPYRKKRYGSRTATTARKALSIAKKVAKEIDFRELKNLDNNFLATSVPSSGFATTFNVPPQGIGQGQRIGDELLVKGIDFRAQIVNNGATTTMTRVIIVIDYKNTLSSISLLLDFVGSGLTAMSPYQREFRNTYKVLFDKVFMTDGVSRGQQLVRFSKKFKMGKEVKQTFQPGSGSLTQNVIRTFLVSDVLVGVAPTVDAIQRLYYTDA